jgi:RimJ/RimL family protein N-acetyltransferase
VTRSPDDLATDRLRLEPLRVDHADEMVAVLADPALYTFTGGEPPTLDGLRERYGLQARGQSPDGTEVWHNWIVRVAGDDGAPGVEPGGSAIGFVQATVTDGGRAADVAWVVGVPWQGLGYATEAAIAMVDWLVVHGVRTVTAHVHPDHEASAGVARRLGFAPTERIEDGEVVWRRVVTGKAARDDDPERRRRLSRLNLGVGTALIGFALFEVVFVRTGQLPGSPDQVARDVLLVIAGIAMLVGALLAWRRPRAPRRR